MISENIGSFVKGWVPVKLYTENDNWFCRWLYVGDKDFTEPFFDETIAACKHRFSENWHTQRNNSTIPMLPQFAAGIATVAPTAFIFHISRCGSTLLSQMLAMQPANIVLAEVPFFDELLRNGKKNNCMAEVLPQLQAAISLYAAKRKPAQQQLFIKTDSWHIHFYKELRQLYPNVPFFLLYRKPGEVLRSQQKKRGMQSIPNLLEPQIFGFEKDVTNMTDLDEYMAMVIESYLLAFENILQTDKLAFALNYHDGAMHMMETIGQVTNLPVTDDEKNAMQQRAGFSAKFPDQVFSEDPMHEPVPLILERSVELYNKIEKQRLASV